MRTVTTLQGSGCNNKLSRKGIPSSHAGGGKSRGKFYHMDMEKAQSIKSCSFKPWEHSGLLTMTHFNVEYKQRITAKRSKENLMSICMPPSAGLREQKEESEENTQTSMT